MNKNMYLTFSLNAVFWCITHVEGDTFNLFKLLETDHIEKRYGAFPEKLRLQMVKEAKEMFYFGYTNYMKHAFPMDELNPILCSGRGPDYDNP